MSAEKNNKRNEGLKVPPEEERPIDPATGKHMSKSAYKKWHKAQARQKAKEAKAAAAAAAKAEQGTGGAEDAGEDEEEGESKLSDEEYGRVRRAALAKFVAEKPGSRSDHPHKFHATCSVPHFRAVFGGDRFKPGEKDESNTEIGLAGRLMRKAKSGKKLFFMDLVADDERVQIFCNFASAKDKAEFARVVGLVRRGDVVGVRGIAGVSKRGELSLFATEIKLLAPCLHHLPGPHYALADQETIYRKRYLHFMVNRAAKSRFFVRAQVIAFIRRFLDSRGFLEVETPVLTMKAGGANAKPFESYYNDLEQDVFLRVAPELFLKQLIVGGFDRVYEIGKQFRNEGLDATHSPEFTSCEFYWAYADVHDLMKLTETMLSEMVFAINGGKSYKTLYHRDGLEEPPVEVDWKPPYAKLDYIGDLEKAIGKKLPRPLTSDACRELLLAECEKHNVEVSAPKTTARLLDKLVGELLEAQHPHKPCFIINHPELSSPLAKAHRSLPEQTERFELFAYGKELANAYTELNMADVQRERFEEQARQKAAGDDEAQEVDEVFVNALEYGLPPTGGWGLGIDRIVMFLTDAVTIKDVQLFPAMRPEVKDGGAAAAAAAAAGAAEEKKGAALPLQRTKKPGGTTEETPADDHVRAVCQRVGAELGAVCEGYDWVSYEVVSYKTQLVNGTNYFVKIVAGPNHEVVHARIYVPIQQTKPVELVKVERGKKKEDPIEYF